MRVVQVVIVLVIVNCLLSECSSLNNLSELELNFQLDYNGSEIKPGGLHSSGGHACDLNINSTQWFRFSGDAGTHVLNGSVVVQSILIGQMRECLQ